MLINDGGDVVEGTTTDAPATDSTSRWSIESLLRGMLAALTGGSRSLRKTQKTTLSNTTTETTIVTAGGAGVFNDIYKIIFANTGATTTKVDIRDATAGAIIETIEVPSSDTRGWSLPAGSAIPQTTANNNWTAQCASATTAMEISVCYVKTTG